MGKLGFKALKGYRDAVVHARALNAPMGLGIKIDRRASPVEVLLSADALKVLYERITQMRSEISDAAHLFLTVRLAKETASDDPRKAPLEAEASACSFQFQAHHSRRRSLPQLPEFPAEQDIQKAQDDWLQERAERSRAILAEILSDRDQKPKE